MTSTSRAPLVVFSAAFLVGGGIFLYIGGSTVLERWRYRQQGVRVDAVVTDKALQRATASTGTAYQLGYQFTLPDGSSYRQVERVAVPLWERVGPGSPLSVEYVSGTPASARIADDDSDHNDLGTRGAWRRSQPGAPRGRWLDLAAHARVGETRWQQRHDPVAHHQGGSGDVS